MDYKAMGERIKHFREERGYTQEALAEAVNYSSEHISVIERGVKPPRLERLVDIANALEVGLDELLGEDLKVTTKVRASALSDRLAKLPERKKRVVLSVLETLISEFEKDM